MSATDDRAPAKATGEQGATQDGRKAARRRLLALMRREAYVASRIAAMQAVGTPPSNLRWSLGEVQALQWAIEELGRLFPRAFADAQSDFGRAVERRRERGSAVQE